MLGCTCAATPAERTRTSASWQITKKRVSLRVAWHNFCQSEFRDPLHARYAGRFGNDDLDNAGFAGDVTTVGDPHVSRRRLSRSSNAQQSWLTRAASFLGSISLLACSAMVRHSSEYGFMTGLHFHENTLLWRPEPSLSNNAHLDRLCFHRER